LRESHAKHRLDWYQKRKSPRGGTRLPLGEDGYRQKSLNRLGASSVYLTVCWMFPCPRLAAVPMGKYYVRFCFADPAHADAFREGLVERG
jgi:hypothetical protein